MLGGKMYVCLRQTRLKQGSAKAVQSVFIKKKWHKIPGVQLKHSMWLCGVQGNRFVLKRSVNNP